jgi:hypothetical protein
VAANKVMTVRVDSELLEQLRARACAERRSVSGQVLYFVREGLADAPRPTGRPQRTLGWLSHLEATEDLEDFREVRRELSRSMAKRGPRRP